MSAYHLFIEGVATGPGVNAAQVAVAIGARFGIDAAEISRRLASGRFRVKSNVDYQTASSFRQELERLGVRCAILDATSGVAIESPAAAPQHPAAKPAAAAKPAPSTSGNQAQYQSGLAAALGNSGKGDGGVEALGALATGAFRLTALDNKDDEAPTGVTDVDPGPNDQVSVTTFDAPPQMLTEAALPSLASLAPSAPRASAPMPATVPDLTFLPVTKSKPPIAPAPAAASDEFAPPSEGLDEPSLSLLVDVRKERQEVAVGKTMSQALPAPDAARASAEFPSPDGHAARNSSHAVDAVGTAPSPLAKALEPANRWLIGLALALLLGFSAAHAYASGKEAAAFAAVDSRIEATQAAVVTPTEWEALDSYRTLELAKKHAAKRSIAQSAAFVWVLVSVALGLLWHLAVPWQRIAQAQRRQSGDHV